MKLRDCLPPLLDKLYAFRGDEIGMVCREQRLTYGELMDDVRDLAGGFAEFESSRGYSVANWLPSQLGWVVPYRPRFLTSDYEAVIESTCLGEGGEIDRVRSPSSLKHLVAASDEPNELPSAPLIEL
jgi:hypothetical protein